MMDDLEDADLDNLIELINEKDEFPTTESKKDSDLDCLFNLINENDVAQNGSESSTITNISSNGCQLSESSNCITTSKSNTIKKGDINCYKDVDLFSTPSKEPDLKETNLGLEASLIHTGDTSEEEEEEKEYITEEGNFIKKRLSKPKFSENNKRSRTETWKVPAKSKRESVKLTIDEIIGIRLKNPLVPFDLMQQRMQGRSLIKLSHLSSYKNKKEFENNWVTVAVVVRKLPPRESKAGKMYSVWKLCDLHDCEKIVTFFLFGKVHTEHWKISVGTVIGLLNPSFMDSKDSAEGLCIQVDHPAKLMLIGTSRDFSFCKSKNKIGDQCKMIVNISHCEYCSYHVKSEYQKFNKRSEIQSSFAGQVVNLKNKILKGQNFFYAGQTFTPLGKPEKSKSKINTKDRLTLTNLTLKRKAATVENAEKKKGVEKLEEIYGNEISKVAERNSEFINDRLAIPSAGSKNFLLYMTKNTAPEGSNITIMTSKELMKMHQNEMMKRNAIKKADAAILANLTPQLGKNVKPGQGVSLDSLSRRPKISMTPEDYAKVKAIRKIQENGPIKRQNPNSVKCKPDVEKINKAVSKTESDNDPKNENSKLVQSKLGVIDLNSERIQEILKRKSSHAYEVEMAEMEREAAYFDRMEKRESMEEKMRTTTEVVCDVISCKQCRYTAHSASERCKNECHPLKMHKAIKRFFNCKDCKYHTQCFTRFPQRSCRNCGGSCFERTGMKVRKGPKLDSEVLNICSDEAFFLNSL